MKDVLLHGDCLQQLKTLPAESVQCIVTSPPYFGLRDYQTATWVGGSPACDHQAAVRAKAEAIVSNRATMHGGIEHTINCAEGRVKACPSCGATRQDAQIGLEETPDAYVAKLVEVFREARRVLRKDGVLWLNLGDSYSSNAHWSGGGPAALCGNTKRVASGKNGGITPGFASKQLLGMPWRVAFALQADGWILRSDVIWHKPNCMPESVKDRPTKAHEYMFLFSKQERYYYDADAIREAHSPKSWNESGSFRGGQKPRPRGAPPGAKNPGTYERSVTEMFNASGRNKRTVWTIATAPYAGAHFATFPPALIEPCILAGSRAGDVVLDPFFGAGTVGLVAKQHGRSYLGIELNAAYIALAEQRIAEATKPRAKITRLPKRPQRAEQLALFA